MKSSFHLGITGFFLIAVSYGLARFSWGLMLPLVANEIPFSPRLAGLLSACSFAAYCLSVTGASLLCKRFGPRLPASASALCAAAGLLIMSISTSMGMLATGLFIAGLSAGLSSPSLAVAVSQRIAKSRQTQVNTIINAGTGGGIVISVPVLLYLPGGWRATCVLFAIIALICLVPVLRYLPYGRHFPDEQSGRIKLLQRTIVRLSIIAFVSGMASAAWWSFGPDVLRQHANVAGNLTNLLWLVCGGAGILGAFTGPLARVIGMRQVYRLSLLCMAAPLLLMAFSDHFSWWLIPAVALCGVGYIALSGVLLVAGAMATPQAPASGVGIVFFMLAIGQVVGAPGFGLIYAQAGAPLALILFALLALIMTFVTPQIGHEQ
ncbi:MFS transporter [Salmonella enterica]